MSRTFHHFSNYEDSLKRIEKGWLYKYYWSYFYGKSPKWFRNIYTHRRLRRNNKNCIHKQLNNLNNDISFPDKKKPLKYYW